MTKRKIEELAEEAVREMRREGRVFETDHVRKDDGLWEIAFAHGKTLLKISIDAKSYNTETAIYQEIWRQLVNLAEMIEKRPPSKRPA
jgi:Cdc6-like AAA superfamily ATPase